ncbi:type II toxin-antitoxin system VapC family toxin [Candidatus Gottesmanbacteria bacterium]|nr:type II toxin-antitoxin system VapC family toxin [Candidatus Gottesmanbacteria bacterium]
MLIDTNLIIYAINTASPKHSRAQQFLRDNQNLLAVAHQNILESIRVLTHEKFSHPMTFAKAEKAVMAIVSVMAIISPAEETLPIALMLMEKYAQAANRIFDVYLVATMLTHGIKEIATDNDRDFNVLKEISVFNPFSSRGN